MLKTRSGILLAAVTMVVASGCAHSTEAQIAQEQATTKGKYAVRLTEDSESVVGTCKYVHSIQPDDDPVSIPRNSQLPDYYRVKAVLMGADTVVVRGRTGEAYICGPGPLNPDGTLKGPYGAPSDSPH